MRVLGTQINDNLLNSIDPFLDQTNLENIKKDIKSIKIDDTKYKTIISEIRDTINPIIESSIGKTEYISNNIETTLKDQINELLNNDVIPTKINELSDTINSYSDGIISTIDDNVNEYVNPNTEYIKIAFIVKVSLLGLFLILKIVAEPYIGKTHAYRIILFFFTGKIQTILYLLSIILIILYNKNLCKKTLTILGIDKDIIEKYHSFIKLNAAVILFLIGTVIFMLFNLYKTGSSLISLGVLIILLQNNIILSNIELFIPKSLQYGILPIVSGILLIIGNYLLNKTKK